MKDKEDSFHLGVKAVIFNRKGNLLVLQRNSEIWDIPGGRVQKKETLEAALKREIYEEIGVKDVTLISPFTMALSNIRIPVQSGDVGLIFAIYQCHIKEEASICLSEEHIRFEWVDSERAVELLVNFPAELIKKVIGKK